MYPNKTVLKEQQNTYCVPDADMPDLRMDRGRDARYLPHTRMLGSGEGSRSRLRPVEARPSSLPVRFVYVGSLFACCVFLFALDLKSEFKKFKIV
jgi:hypothetical protein